MPAWPPARNQLSGALPRRRQPGQRRADPRAARLGAGPAGAARGPPRATTSALPLPPFADEAHPAHLPVRLGGMLPRRLRWPGRLAWSPVGFADPPRDGGAFVGGVPGLTVLTHGVGSRYSDLERFVHFCPIGHPAPAGRCDPGRVHRAAHDRFRVRGVAYGGAFLDLGDQFRRSSRPDPVPQARAGVSALGVQELGKSDEALAEQRSNGLA